MYLPDGGIQSRLRPLPPGRPPLMLIRFGFEIEIKSDGPVPMIAALLTHSARQGRLIGEDRIRSAPDVAQRLYLDPYGNWMTRFVAPGGTVRLWSDAVVEIDGEPEPQGIDAEQHAVEDLPDEMLQFLLASRYCESDALAAFAWQRFGDTAPGWARVQAICDYVHTQTTFDYKFGRPDKTALNVKVEKTGVCRDFAHLSVALCRAMNIPARYASGYLGDIRWEDTGPGDFSAWFEVYLGGRWWTVDARFNTPRIGRILMVRGCDAADVALITSFGAYELTFFRVWTDEIAERGDAEVLSLLQTRPEGAALVHPSSARMT